MIPILPDLSFNELYGFTFGLIKEGSTVMWNKKLYIWPIPEFPSNTLFVIKPCRNPDKFACHTLHDIVYSYGLNSVEKL